MWSDAAMRRIWRAGSSRKTSSEAVATVELTSENWESVVGSGGLVLVTFWMDWSVPCASFGPVFDRASGRHTDIVFGKVNMEDETELAARFDVFDAPTLMVINDSIVRFSRPGALPEQNLEELICRARESKLGAIGKMPAFSIAPGTQPEQDQEEQVSQAREGTMAAPGEGPALSPAPSAAEIAATLKSGLRASYAVNEGSGLLIADQVGGHTLTLTGARWGGGFIGPGLVFSGFPAAATTPCFLDTSKDFSVSAWVWLADTCGWHTAISQDATEVSAFYLQYSAVDNAWAFSMLSDDSVRAHPARAVAPPAPRVAEWQHLAGVHDTEAGQLRLYIDGRRAATAPFSGRWPATGSFVVGRGLFGGPADWFAGGIDQIRVWSRALSDTEALGLT
jgi:thiol-disulfide isomerase/thioredoxin